MQAQRDVRIFRGVFGGAIDRHLVERELLRAFAGDVLEFDRRDAEIARARCVSMSCRVATLFHTYDSSMRVVAHAGEADAVD